VHPLPDAYVGAFLFNIQQPENTVKAARLRSTLRGRMCSSRLAQAQRTGDLSFINKEFRRRRLEAQAAGQPFMRYSTVQGRLRKAIVSVAAGGAPAIIQRVFGSDA
jgi:hypothetical protein